MTNAHRGIDVRDFGAKADGVTDDSAAIQAAISAAAGLPGVIVVPSRRRTLHWVWSWLATLVALCALAALASAQTAPPVSNLQMSPQVVHFLDSLALDARTNRVENGACLGAYSVKDSTLTLERLDPAHYLKADSVTIWGDTATHYAGICPPGIPTLHTHVSAGGLTPPSDIDRNTARLRGVWNLLLQARRNGYLVFVY